MRKRTENKELKQALDEINDIDDMLKKEGKSYGERRYRKIMYTSVFLILDSLRSLEKRGKELADMGITIDNIKDRMFGKSEESGV